MDIYVLGHNKMGQTGESLLKLIQNSSLSTIDLLVRESIQNSLDAARPDNDSKVTVDIRTGSCPRQELDGIFTGISDALQKKIPGSEADYIAIRDSGTVGLTGPLREADVKDEKGFGNLRKLIYEICQAQPGEGKGGSWGLGKTVYFRVGIGIVLYYSRIQLEDGTYASRMAAALIEDNSREDSLLKLAGQKNGNLYCGVAWWGTPDGAHDTMPITDEDEIERILDIFEIEPYKEDETGTTVIIPYIDREKLHDNANIKDAEVFDRYSLEEMINLAVQRWYAPRLYNNSYKYGPCLEYRCNRHILRTNDRVKFFNILQKLYNEAPEKGTKIGVNKHFCGDSCAGHLHFAVVSKEELNMNVPHNCPSPREYLLKNNEEEIKQKPANPPILAYCRKAGMVVNYELHGEWVSGVHPTQEDEYLIAFFVLNSEQKMLNNPQLSLDEYIRQGEKADHMSWQDHVVNGHKYQVVSRLHTHVRENLKEIAPAEDEGEEKRTKINSYQKKMGAFFLPAQNFGQSPTGQRNVIGGSASNPGGNRKSPGINNLRLTHISDNKIDIKWSVITKKKESTLTQEILAQTSKLDTATSWEKDIGLPFPFAIEMVEAVYKKEPLTCELICSEKNVNYAFKMDTANVEANAKGKSEIQCHMVVCCNDMSVLCDLSIRETAE